MFDISLFEMVVIGVVALIVIGPERLPGVARTAGHLFGRMQRYVNEVKSDIQREIELDELRKLRETVQESAREIEQSMNRELEHADQEMRELRELIEPAAERRSEPTGSAETPSEHAPGTTAELPDASMPQTDAAPRAAAQPGSARKPDTKSEPNSAPEAGDVVRSGVPADTSRSA